MLPCSTLPAQQEQEPARQEYGNSKPSSSVRSHFGSSCGSQGNVALETHGQKTHVKLFTSGFSSMCSLPKSVSTITEPCQKGTRVTK
mmetsp:Transcript_19598/g.23087  ORF Transcript_19598/g.23087 Transcript_19598/m.23087 type:complete len:87 (+) Transcript_19598:15-275(+)